MIDFDEALAIVRQYRWSGSTELPIAEATGHRLVQDFVALYDSPPFTSSAMDGFAVGSKVGPWKLIGDARAGTEPPPIRAGEAVSINTGAMIPKGAFAVVAKEDAFQGGPEVSTSIDVKEGRYFRLQGEEFHAGDLLIPAGARLTPPVLATIASQGSASISVHSAPTVGLITTGGELTALGSPLAKARIFDSNSVGLTALLRSLGCAVVAGQAIDDLQVIRGLAEHFLNKVDAIVSVGGVSVGAFDFVRPAMEALGFEIHFSQVNIRPGRPMTFATRPDGKVWFGLPGNPMSALTTCCLFVASYLGEELEFRPMPLLEAHSRQPGREDFLPASVSKGRVILAETVGSHATRGLAMARGVARIPAGAELLEAGSSVLFAKLPWV